MVIYLDFEMTGIAAIDGRLAESLLVARDAAYKTLKPYEKQIDEKDIFVFLRFIPDEFGIGFANISIDDPLYFELNMAAATLNIEEEIVKYVTKFMN